MLKLILVSRECVVEVLRDRVFELSEFALTNMQEATATPIKQMKLMKRMER